MRQTHRTRRLVLPALGLMLVAAALPAFAEERDWKLSTSLNYESGTYGTGTRSSSLYVPFTVKRYWGDWYASATLPFVSQTSDGRVTNVGGRSVRTGRARGSSATTTHSGIGDMVVRGGYVLLREDPKAFDLDLVAKVKLPTADKDKGLGTGELDSGFGLEFAKIAAPGWTVLADLYYTVVGDPPGVDLNNEASGDIGVARVLQKDLTATVLLEASNALVPGERAPIDARGILEYTLDEHGRLFGGGLIGLSRGSADYGFTLGGSYRFKT